MPEAVQQASIPELLRFRDDLELGDGLFQEITGLSVSALFAYRRGRLKEKPKISADAVQRIERSREVLRLGVEMNGDQEKALNWVYTESPNFNGRSPIDLTVSDASLESVRIYIARLRVAVGVTASQANTHTPNTGERLKPVPQETRWPAPQQEPRQIALEPVVQIASPPPSEPKDTELDKEKQSNPKKAKGAPTIGPKENAAQKVNVAPSKLTPPPPTGIAPGARAFRIKEPLAKFRALKPDLSLKAISQSMVNSGFKQFGSTSYMSRLANSYTWATWEEVVAIAKILDVQPRDLGCVYNLPS